MTSEARRAVIAEAETWLTTPFHHEARVRGVGVDCGQLLIAVYGALGYMPADYKLAHYPADFAQHRGEEWYLGIVESFARRVEAPLPGDVVLFKWGRSFSHGGIVVAWPEIIHAWIFTRNVMRIDTERTAKLSGKERRFYSPFGDAA